MKKTFRILAIFMVITILSLTLVSCSDNLSGKYSNNIGGIETTYDFGLFGKVTRTIFIPGVISDGETIVKEGKYEISKDDDGSLEITLEFDGEGSETHSFSKGEENGEKYIKIGLFEYKKTK